MISLCWRPPQLLCQHAAVYTEADVSHSGGHHFSVLTLHLCQRALPCVHPLVTSLQHLGAPPRASSRGHRGKATCSTPIPSTNKDNSTVRSLWTTFPPNHCTLPYDNSSWSKLPEVPCCLGWFSPPAFALHHPTLRTTVQMFRAIWLACSQMESCPGVKMALEEGQDCPVTPFSHQTPALVAEGWDTRVSICVSAPLGSD